MLHQTERTHRRRNSFAWRVVNNWNRLPPTVESVPEQRTLETVRLIHWLINFYLYSFFSPIWSFWANYPFPIIKYLLTEWRRNSHACKQGNEKGLLFVNHIRWMEWCLIETKNLLHFNCINSHAERCRDVIYSSGINFIISPIWRFIIASATNVPFAHITHVERIRNHRKLWHGITFSSTLRNPSKQRPLRS